jgi:tetrahydromethanopterin S-methyltransferase subunit G
MMIVNEEEIILPVKYVEQLQQENARLKEIENKLNFIKNRVKQGMSQENINKCAIELVNSYLKEN